MTKIKPILTSLFCDDSWALNASEIVPETAEESGLVDSRSCQVLSCTKKSKHWTTSPRHEFHVFAVILLNRKSAIYKSHIAIYKSQSAIYKSHFVIYKSQDYELCDL